MSANKNAQLRYPILDRCFSNFRHKYTIDDLMEEVNEKLYDLSGTEVSLRQIREDIKFMRDSAGYNVPIEAYPLEGRKCYYYMQTATSRSSIMSSPQKKYEASA